MQTTESEVTVKTTGLPRLAGIGTAISAIGLLVVFWGYATTTLSTVGMGAFFVGLGLFIALVSATVYLFSKGL